MADTSSDSPQVGESSAAGAGGDNTALPKQKSAKELAKEAKRLEKLEKFKAKQEKQAQQPKKAPVEVSCAFHIHAPVIILVINRSISQYFMFVDIEVHIIIIYTNFPTGL